MDCNNLMAIRIYDRDSNANHVQDVLTKHGCKIRTRIGLHDPDENNVCSTSGTLILQLCCTVDECKAVAADLSSIKGVKAQFIDLN